MKLMLILIVFCWSMICSSEDVKIIKNPIPNCVESNFKKLIKYKELKESEKTKEYLVSPFSLVVDENENIFVYDMILAKIFKYDSNLKLIKTFGGKGRGPGEIGGINSRNILGSLFIKKNKIYFGDWYNKKIICFNTDGNLICEIPFKERLSFQIVPIVDNHGNIYLHADQNKSDKYIIEYYDGKGKYLGGLLDRANLFVGLYTKPEPELQKIPDGMKPDWYSSSTSDNIQFAINEKNQLFVYSSTSGYFWLFNDDKFQKTGKLWPKNALLDYKIKLREVSENGGFYPFLRKLIFDQDNPEYILLHYGCFNNGNEEFIYQFDLNGKLGKIYSVLNNKKTYFSIEFMKNNKFYCISRNNDDNSTISIYKEGQIE